MRAWRLAHAKWLRGTLARNAAATHIALLHTPPVRRGPRRVARDRGVAHGRRLDLLALVGNLRAQYQGAAARLTPTLVLKMVVLIATAHATRRGLARAVGVWRRAIVGALGGSAPLSPSRGGSGC